MPLFGEFERRLREFLYITFVKAFKNNWLNETINCDLQAVIKSNPTVDKQRLIENALDQLTYEQLKTLLFEPFSKEDIYCLLDDELSEKNISQLTAIQIIRFLDSCRKRSLWSRFFANNADIKDMQSDIDYLQGFRNKVMHHKALSYDEYVELRKRLRTVNNNLKKAIHKLESIIYKEEDYGNIVLAFTNFAKMIKENFNAVSQSFAQLGRAMSAIVTDSCTQSLAAAANAILLGIAGETQNTNQGYSTIEQENELEEVDKND